MQVIYHKDVAQQPFPGGATYQTLVGDEPPTQEKASATDLVYETSDGWITVAVQTNQQWLALTRALDTPAAFSTCSASNASPGVRCGAGFRMTATMSAGNRRVICSSCSVSR